MRLENLRIYQQSMDIADEVWERVSTWDFLAKNTVGKQWMRAVDSIAANISEGYGRYHYKEHRQFLFYARGSLYESTCWLHKASKRDLINQEAAASFHERLENLAPQLNSYIRSIGSSQNVVKEESEEYLTGNDYTSPPNDH